MKDKYEKLCFENLIKYINTLEEKKLNFINADYLENNINFIDKELCEEVKKLVKKIKDIQNEK